MEKKKASYQLKSFNLWKDSVTSGLAIFGIISAVVSFWGTSISGVFNSDVISAGITALTLVASYMMAVLWKWLYTKDRISLRIRGINVTVRQGDIFEQKGWKVIGTDDAFNTSEDDAVISHLSLHGKLLKILRDNNQLEAFKRVVSSGEQTVPIGSVKTYKDYILLAWTHFDCNNEAHIKYSNYESILRRMWHEISRVYSGRAVYLPVLGDGITRFDDISEKPSSFDLIRCMLCTLKTSNVQLKASVTILIYDRINEINLYDLKRISE